MAEQAEASRRLQRMMRPKQPVVNGYLLRSWTFAFGEALLARGAQSRNETQGMPVQHARAAKGWLFPVPEPGLGTENW